MIRLLGLLGLIFALVWLFRQNKAKAASPRNDPAPPPAEGEKMLSCAKCGVFIPASEAIQKQDHYYCCEQHAH